VHIRRSGGHHRELKNLRLYQLLGASGAAVLFTIFLALDLKNGRDIRRSRRELRKRAETARGSRPATTSPTPKAH
jgi:hypothetical protein